MASFNIHLAIGKRYIEKGNKIDHEEDFFRGIIAPDLVEDKAKSHYSGIQDKNNLLEYLANKVDLYEYLKKNEIHSDYQKGVFLHLITDYLFFNCFFDKTYLKNISYEEFCKDLYVSYDFINDYLEKQYKLSLTGILEEIKLQIAKDKKEKNITKESRKNILPQLELDQFIEYVSDISLEAYRDNIIKNKKNVFPENETFKTDCEGK